MKLLLDTHVALWSLFDSGKLPTELRPLVASRDNLVYVSLVSVWEVAIKHALKPENMPVPEELFAQRCAQAGFAQLPLTANQIFRVKELRRPPDAPKHNDPFDRLLIAQAKEEGLTFVTHDSLLPYYDEPCIALY